MAGQDDRPEKDRQLDVARSDSQEGVLTTDHGDERVPERVVHARGGRAYGYFETYGEALAGVTAAEFLTRRTYAGIRAVLDGRGIARAGRHRTGNVGPRAAAQLPDDRGAPRIAVLAADRVEGSPRAR
jgi:Catalase